MPETSVVSEEEKFASMFEKHESRLGGLEAYIKGLQEKPDKDTTPDARMEESAVAGITKTFKRMPYVGYGTGFVAATFASELTDVLMVKLEKWQRGLVKVGEGALAYHYGGKWNKDFAIATSILLFFDGVRDLIPLDTWAKGAVTKVAGAVTNKGLAQNDQEIRIEKESRVLREADGVLSSAQKMSVRS